MIFLCNAQGTITSVIPEPINQGSIGVNRIVLIAPYPKSTVISATFTLPNGMKLYPQYVGKGESTDYDYLMSAVESFDGKGLNIDGVTVNVWQLTLDKALTQLAGNVKVQFLAMGDGGVVLGSTSTEMPINRGNAYLNPSVSAADLNSIAAYLNAAENAATAAETAQAAAETAAEETKLNADRYSPWDVVASQEIVIAVLNGMAYRGLKSYLFLNVDFTKLNLNNFINGDGIPQINIADSIEKVEFRGCTFADRQGNPLALKFHYQGSQCSISGAKGDELIIEGFADVIDCRANIIKDSEYVAACDANVLNDCMCVTDSTASEFTRCLFVDPYTVNGFVPVEDVGKVPTLTASGEYEPAALAHKIAVKVNNTNYELTVDLIDFNNNVISTGSVDLPIESMIIGATINGDGDLVLTLQNGNTLTVPVSNIVSGLATEDWVKSNVVLKLDSEYEEQVYAQDGNGNISLKRLSPTPYANAVVRRASDASLLVRSNPSRSDEAINKGYVDNLFNRTIYDVATNQIGRGDGEYAKVTISGVDELSYAFRAICEYSNGDTTYTADIHTVMFAPDINNSDNSACDIETPQLQTAPVNFKFDGNDAIFYFPIPPTSSYRILLKGLNRKITNATIEAIDAVPANTQKTSIINVLQSEVTYSPSPNKIVRRNSAGEVLMPSRSSWSSNAAVPRSYIELKFAPKTEVADIDERVSFLEGALLEYVEDTSAAYEKQIPEGVASKAILNSAQGSAAVTGKNLFNPALVNGAVVNSDGSFTLEYNFGEENWYNHWYASVKLPAGTYYYSGEYPTSTFGTVYAIQYQIIDTDTYGSAGGVLWVGEESYVTFEFYLDGVGVCGGTFEVMLSKAQGLSFEPYESTESVLTSVDVISSNLLDYTELVAAEDLIQNGIRVPDYIITMNLSYNDFMLHLGVSPGDTVTVSATVKAYDSEGNTIDIQNDTQLLWEGPNTQSILLRESGYTYTFLDNPEAWEPRIVSGVYYTGSYTEITNIMVVKGSEKASYVPYQTEPISTFAIPSQIQALAEQNIGCTIDFTNKRLVSGNKSIDISAYLSNYTDFKFIDVMPSALIRFSNEAKAALESTVTYVKPKGGT